MRLGVDVIGVANKTVVSSPATVINQYKIAIVLHSPYRGKTAVVISILCE